jgi:hypothetical protein
MTEEPTGKKKSRRKAVAPLSKDAFENRQLNLFQYFLANTEDNREVLSNAIDLWDSIPRYAVSRTKMKALRTTDGFLDVMELSFNYRGRTLTALIHPARITDKDGNRLSYYPSAREELIEHALRKISIDQHAGFFHKPSYRSGVRFSLHGLRKELQQQGHTLRYDELIEGLNILSLSTIEILAKNEEGNEAFARSTYLAALTGVRRKDYEADHTARWAAQFHPLVTQGIDRVAYRQFNYQRLMRCTTQLARWLIGQLVLKYTQAALINSFEMRYSTIRRDSALLNGYARERDAVTALDDAWEELKVLGSVATIKKEESRGVRGKLEEVIYTVYPTREFVTEQKAANRRQYDAVAAIQLEGQTGIDPLHPPTLSQKPSQDRPAPPAIAEDPLRRTQK